MLGHSAIADAAIADVGGVVQAATAEMSGVGVTVNLSSNFIQTTELATTLSGNIDLTSNFTQTTENIKLINLGTASIDANFIQTTQGNHKFNGTSSQQFSFTKTATGDILFEEVVTNANIETYTEITPSGTETYTEITPSGTETWTEIQ